ncbi:MAG: hypothetical protein ACT4OV_08600 [Microthrixaceae bacterium]
MNDPSPSHISQADLDGLNRRALLRSSELVRRAGTGLLWIAAALATAWLWQLVRFQQILTDSVGTGGFGIDGPNLSGISWTQRIDSIAASLGSLGVAAITAGVGVAVRLYAEVVALQQGADITPWQLGDEIDDPDED